MDDKKLVDEILKLKKEKNASILAHNYQSEEIQLIADHLGDSLELARISSDLNNDVIVFCGVSFMAESAKVLSPEKVILHPVREARCPMADMINAKKVRELRKKYPKATFVAYINTNVETKMEIDVVCTSANAVDIVRKIPNDRIVFLPDKNLGRFVKDQVPEKDVVLYDGYCYVHDDLDKDQLLKLKEKYHDAITLTHPEANEEVSNLSDHLLGTGGMLKFVKNSKNKRFIIGTEEGMIQRLARENPNKEFFATQSRIICKDMKKITLNNVYNSLKNNRYEIKLSEEIIKKAEKPLEMMLKYSHD
jgi:quinolinate synthase